MDQGARVQRERVRLLVQIERMLDGPMVVLGAAWLILLLIELLSRSTPAIQRATFVVWGCFIAEYVIKLAVAPRKLQYLRRNWIGLLALAVPAFRIVRLARVLRLARLARGGRLLRIVSTINRSMRSLRVTMRRRRFGYVLTLFVLVDLVGAAGMYAFERDVPGTPLSDYATAVWWTTMLLTTFGTDAWPKTPEGRILCALLAFFAIGVLGYVTAALASFFVGADVSRQSRERGGRRAP